MHELLRWVQPSGEASISAPVGTAGRLWAVIASLPISLLRICAYAWIFRRRIGQYLGRLLRGDRDSAVRVVWFARSFVFPIGRRPS